MSHVWVLNMKTDEAKKTFLDAGLLSVKDRPCLVVDPGRQEVRLKLHSVAFDVDIETVRRAFWEHNEVKKVISDKKAFRRIAYPIRYVSGVARHWWSGQKGRRCACVAGTLNTFVAAAVCAVALVVALLGMSRWTVLVPTPVQQVKQQMSPHTELLGNEKEVERATASEAAVEASHAVATSEREMERPKQDTDENMVMGTRTQRRSSWTETQHKPEPVIGPDATLDIDTVEITPVKRRLNEGGAAS
ncbi:hypothetical protein HPB51_010315 [Rhipicephalus microplus]|uniref:Transmembrane protein n=1 Tax=Rhipicephalus microplus TaxID=6941 RepID=A0A9J6D4Z7_RHIMP|nr:hypothetical protein HPB51_010315 [Rhipicephalus microplus]